MIIIPAIDIRNGKCVRLMQGKADAETIFSDDPLSVAVKWQNKGAKLIHVVDLDGAFAGKPRNLNIIREIANTVTIPIEMGGGIRDHNTIEEVFQAGVYRAILGTSALKDYDFVEKVCQRYGEKIAVGIDAKDGMVATHGWTEVAEKPAADFAIEMEKAGVKTIIYTDIKKDGMLTGPNIEATKAIANSTKKVEIIASGGVSSIKDIINLKSLEAFRVTGVIIGKALYTGDIDLQEAISEALKS